MISFEEVGLMLDDIAAELPEQLFEGVNGGVSLLPEAKLHPQSRRNDKLYILGEYNCNHTLGKYIVIYYGSFVEVYASLSRENQKEKLKQILCHEFTHHFEIMAGEKGLEIKDADDLHKYLHDR